MFYSFWNNGSFPSAWQFYVPLTDMNGSSCSIPQVTQTHIEENTNKKSEGRNVETEKKMLIELSQDDLIDAGY